MVEPEVLDGCMDPECVRSITTGQSRRSQDLRDTGGVFQSRTNTYVTKKNLQPTGTAWNPWSTLGNTLPLEEVVELQSPGTCCLDESGKRLWKLLHTLVLRHQSNVSVAVLQKYIWKRADPQVTGVMMGLMVIIQTSVFCVDSAPSADLLWGDGRSVKHKEKVFKFLIKQLIN